VAYRKGKIQWNGNKYGEPLITENGGRAYKNKLPTLSKKDKANGKKIKQVV
jgi:hypothetical protein